MLVAVLSECRNGFYADSTKLRTEREARRIIDPFKSRSWKIASSTTQNRMKSNTAYKLVPYGNSLPHCLPGAQYLVRGGFLKRHLWVTRYNPEEIFPGTLLASVFRVVLVSLVMNGVLVADSVEFGARLYSHSDCLCALFLQAACSRTRTRRRTG